MAFLTKTEKVTLKFIWSHKRSWRANAILRKRKRVGSISLPDFKLYYQAIATKNTMVLTQKQTHRLMEQNQEPRNKPMHIRSTNIWQRSHEYSMGKRQILLLLQKNWIFICKRMKSDTYRIPVTKINSKGVKDLKVRPKL